MIPARLNFVTRVVDDVLASREFYESLGWKAAHSPRPDYARFVTGGATLLLWASQEASDEVAASLAECGHDFHRFTLAIAVESPDAVDQAIDQARRTGATILCSPVERAWGGRSGYFCDTDGTTWEVAWIPDATIGDGGGLSWPT